MKIAIYRPHCSIWFKNPSRRILSGNVIPSKYSALFDVLAEEKGRLYICGELVYPAGLKGRFLRFLELSRIVLWACLNKIDLRRVGVVLDRDKFEDMDAVIFMYYGYFTEDLWAPSVSGSELAKIFSETRVKKIVHMTHFAFQSRVGGENLKILKPDLLVAENNLQKNSGFFMQHFGRVAADFYHLPFVPAERFRSYKSFDSRINKLGVTGTISYKINEPEFKSYFGGDELQPMRRQLYENRSKYSKFIDTLMYDHGVNNVESSADSDREVSGKKDESNELRRSYYKENIVGFYNSYMMFAVPEEVCDLPGIGFIEGMACGAAYFGVDSSMYTDIGMMPGIHYVSYDGTLEGLISKVNYYQKNLAELEVIAKAGQEFANGKMSCSVVYGAFLKRIEDIVKLS